MSDLRLLLWAPNGAGLHYNGPGMSAYRLLSQNEPGDGLRVSLAHGYPRQDTYPTFSDQTLISSVSASIPSQLAFIWRGRKWIRQHRNRFDVFYGLQAFDFTVEPALSAHSCGIPAIVKVVQHNADLADRTGWRSLLGRTRRRRNLLATLSGVVAISQAIASELLSYGIPERLIARIPNGVDSNHFHPVRSTSEKAAMRVELGWPEEIIILFVGAVIPRKRPHLLIEALGILKGRGLRPHLAMLGPIGNKHYHQSMTASAAALGVEKQLHWSGFTDDTAPYYRAADIFALPSRNEGMPNALLEAMASGLPSVVTPLTGIADLVRDGEEAIFAQPDATSVADALSEYIQSSSLRADHGNAAHTRANRLFGVRGIFQRHLRLYQRVLAGQDAAES